MKDRYKILDCEVDLMTFNESFYFVMQKLEEQKGARIVTINPEMIMLARENEKVEDFLNKAELIIPDGIGIKIALKMHGIKQERIPGIEFAKALIAYCDKHAYPIALIGGQEEVVNRCKENLLKEYKNLQIVYKRNGYFDVAEEDEIVKNIISVKPRIVFVAMGMPKQEFFMDKLYNADNGIVTIGVGGSFDVWSGFTKRAPEIVQKIGMEWLYRAIKEPQRFRRIFPTLPLFLFQVIIKSLEHEYDVVEDNDEGYE